MTDTYRAVRASSLLSTLFGRKPTPLSYRRGKQENGAAAPIRMTAVNGV
jgi:hypothetical protein